jgi:hypothetical protein
MSVLEEGLDWRQKFGSHKHLDGVKPLVCIPKQLGLLKGKRKGPETKPWVILTLII